ncbi:MAG TPA: Os1348 family NHLP clan protein [Ktedonobacteraceae bacterium]|jgi:hypothetical protein|nr:Os1348 family NHLP clan protein [Ktedonobacteraceae bacterium]
MSWTVINEILGLAAVDQSFCEELLASPLEAVQRRKYELTPKEQAAIQGIVARDIYEFSQILLDRLGSKYQGNEP